MADDNEREHERTALRDLEKETVQLRRDFDRLQREQRDHHRRIAGQEAITNGQRIRLESCERGRVEDNHVIGEIKDRWRERNERFEKMQRDVVAAADSAARAHEILRRTAWSIGGGTAVITFMVALWTLFLEPLLSTLGRL